VSQPGRVDRAGYRLRRAFAATLGVDATDSRLNPLLDAARIYADACVTDAIRRIADATINATMEHAQDTVYVETTPSKGDE
jgi:hypothetical protein